MNQEIEEINDESQEQAGLYCPECENDGNAHLYRLKGDKGGCCGSCFMGRHVPEMIVKTRTSPGNRLKKAR